MIDTAHLKQMVSASAFYAANISGLKTPDAKGWAEAGLCQFHDDNRPGSFYVNVNTGGFYCHSCKASGGDLIEFVMKLDGVSFQEACERLGAVEPEPAPMTKPQPEKKPKRDTGAYARELWLAADWRTVAQHPYAIAKGIDWPAGAARGIASGRVIGRNADCVIVPIRDIQTDKVVAVQCINPDGKKQTFGTLSGNGFVCGNTLDKSIRWFVCEGWADAVSLVFHHYEGNAAAFAACGKGSMDRLAERVAQVYAPDEIIILEDAE